MKRLGTILVLFSAAALAILALFGAGGTASGATKSPTVLNTIAHICLNKNQSTCITFNGVGFPASTTGGDPTDFTFYDAPPAPDGDPVYDIENQRYHCMQAQSDNAVYEEAGACNGYQSESWVLEDSSGSFTLENLKYLGSYMGTFGDQPGATLGVLPPQNGYYISWDTFPG